MDPEVIDVVQNGNTKEIRILISRPSKDEYPLLSLLLFNSQKHITLVRQCLRYGVDELILHSVIENNYLSVVKLLLTYGSSPDGYSAEYPTEYPTEYPADGYPLSIASEPGFTSIAKLLLMYGANNLGANFALVESARSGHFDTVKLLLTYGADVHTDNGKPLRWARGHNVAGLLVEYGAT